MPTMTDIAVECGISRSVVSLVLNGRDKELGIAASTRDQILRVAREIGYCRNELAASIGKKHSQVLAFVTAKMGSIEYTGRIQNGVLDPNDFISHVFDFADIDQAFEKVERKDPMMKMVIRF